jgi:hypothetical protein
MYIPGNECGNYQNTPNVYAIKPTILPCDFTEYVDDYHHIN